MADTTRPRDDDEPAGEMPGPPDPELGDIEAETEEGAMLQPRRAASAEFEVSAEVGAEAAMREAMDPANQSLADALRLSYRVLQGVMVLLVILFLFSGAKTIESGQSGVLLRFGKITGEPGRQALEPGFHWSWLPYPAGEFVVVDVLNQAVDLGDWYWPELGGANLQSAIDSASARRGLNPSEDGFVVLRGGDIAHLKLTANYQMDFPEKTLEMVDPAKARRFVELALNRAVVNVTASLTLAELTELSEDTRSRIRAQAQAALDELGSGLSITEITIPDVKPALAIAKAQQELQNARQMADTQIEEARQRAEQELIRAAGASHGLFSGLIQQFEEATDRDDPEAAATKLASLGELLESDKASGEVFEIIKKARSRQTEIESTLGSQARLFNSLIDAYRRNPELVVNKRWTEVYSQILSAHDAEVFYVPSDVGNARIRLSGLEAVAKARRQRRLDEAGMQAMQDSWGVVSQWTPTAAELADPGKAGRRLKVEDGQVVSPRQ